MKSSLMRAILLLVSTGASTASVQALQIVDLLNSGVTETGKRIGRDQLGIPVRVYDFAHVDRDVLQSAEKLTAEIFRKAGTEVLWLDGPEAHPDNAEVGHPEFRVKIVPTLEMLSGAKEKRKDDPLGFAIPCDESEQACLFYVLYSRISAWAGRDGIDPSRILGHVIAHEIGHALLGPNAHASIGIMQGRLPRLDMGRVLYFTDIQSQQLRADLAGRIWAVKDREVDPSLTILVYNQAQAPPAIVIGAEREAARILSQAGVRTGWFDCSAGHSDAGPQDICQKGWGPMNIGLRVVAKRTGRLQDTRFGFAIIPGLASVYYDYQAHFVSDDVGLGQHLILGCAIAHEIGHLLLGPNSHSSQGVMQAEWGKRQIRQALMRDLLFSPEESRRIRAEARTRMSLQSDGRREQGMVAVHQEAGPKSHSEE
jgi:hypothetical protein